MTFITDCFLAYGDGTAHGNLDGSGWGHGIYQEADGNGGRVSDFGYGDGNAGDTEGNGPNDQYDLEEEW